MNNGYPTKKEYLKNISNIQNNELKTERYKSIYKFINNIYLSRKYKDLEKELFEIVGSFGLEDNLINKSDKIIKLERLKRYNRLLSFLESLTNIQIESNIYLEKARLLFETSFQDCMHIVNEFNRKKDNSTFITLSTPISKEINDIIPNYINQIVQIKYYKPNDYKMAFINVLDSSNEYVYKEFNNYVFRLCKTAEDIYFLHLNNLIINESNIICSRFQIYNTEYEKKFITDFLIKKDLDINLLAKSNGFDSVEEFINVTVENFKELLEMNIIDKSVLDEKKHVLKKEKIWIEK